MTAPTATPSRDSWASRTGFILAAVGSAVGLGNMWRFSYVAAEGGGAAFVLLYLVFVAVIGIPLMTSEFIVGRNGVVGCGDNRESVKNVHQLIRRWLRITHRLAPMASRKNFSDACGKACSRRWSSSQGHSRG